MTETLWAENHIEGDCPDFNNALGEFNDVWAGPTDNNVAWASRWAMEAPSGPLVGNQVLGLNVRKTNHSTNPEVSARLFEDGTPVATIEPIGVSWTEGQVIQVNFDASLFTDHSLIEVEVSGHVGSGAAHNRASLQLDGIGIQANVASAPSGSGSIDGVGSLDAEGNAPPAFTVGSNVVQATITLSPRGQGEITAVGHLDAEGSTARSGHGEITAVGALDGEASTTRSGLGDITAIGAVTGDGSTTTSGDGNISAVGSLEGTGFAPVGGQGEITAVGSLVGSGSTERTGHGAITGVGSVEAEGRTPPLVIEETWPTDGQLTTSNQDQVYEIMVDDPSDLNVDNGNLVTSLGDDEARLSPGSVSLDQRAVVQNVVIDPGDEYQAVGIFIRGTVDGGGPFNHTSGYWIWLEESGDGLRAFFGKTDRDGNIVYWDDTDDGIPYTTANKVGIQVVGNKVTAFVDDLTFEHTDNEPLTDRNLVLEFWGSTQIGGYRFVADPRAGSGDVVAVGDLAGQGLAPHVPGAGGQGEIVAVGTTTGEGTTTRSGAGDVEAVGELQGTGFAPLVPGSGGFGEITAVGALEGSGATTRSGLGSISTEGFLDAQGRSQRSGHGNISAVGELEGQGQSTDGGFGTIEAVAEVTGAGSTDRSGSGSVTAQGIVEGAGETQRSGEGSVVGEASLTGSGQAPTVAAAGGSGTIQAAGDLEATGATTRRGVGVLEAFNVLEAEGLTHRAGLGTLEAIGVLIGQGLSSEIAVSTETVAGKHVTTVEVTAKHEEVSVVGKHESAELVKGSF